MVARWLQWLVVVDSMCQCVNVVGVGMDYERVSNMTERDYNSECGQRRDRPSGDSMCGWTTDVCDLPSGHSGEHQDHSRADIQGEIWVWTTDTGKGE